MYKKLEIDFPIPERLGELIDEFIEYLNDVHEDGRKEDFYRAEIDLELREFHTGLTEEQKRILRDYYVHRGIYEGRGYPWERKGHNP